MKTLNSVWRSVAGSVRNSIGDSLRDLVEEEL